MPEPESPNLEVAAVAFLEHLTELITGPNQAGTFDLGLITGEGAETISVFIVQDQEVALQVRGLFDKQTRRFLQTKGEGTEPRQN